MGRISSKKRKKTVLLRYSKRGDTVFFLSLPGFQHLFFFFAEWGNLYIISALSTALFLGGWNIPEGLIQNPWLQNVAQFFVFEVKTMALVFVIIWLRWTLPRLAASA